MQREELESYLTQLLDPLVFKDYCPNGLQIEGSKSIKHVVTGVTACKALIERAIAINADTILVHHGYFWKNEDYRLIGMKKQRISLLLRHNINLFAYHLPLDTHPIYGNNQQFGELIGVKDIKPMNNFKPDGIVMTGEFAVEKTHQELQKEMSVIFDHAVVGIDNEQPIRKVAWCTGGGQSFIDQVVAEDSSIDAFISGEISEQTTHSAREQAIDYFAVGHHASERYGAKALGEHLSEVFDVKVTFIDIDNPA